MRNGFYKLLKQYKLPYIEEFDITNDNYDEQGGLVAMSKILEQKKRPDAVIAINGREIPQATLIEPQLIVRDSYRKIS